MDLLLLQKKTIYNRIIQIGNRTKYGERVGGYSGVFSKVSDARFTKGEAQIWRFPIYVKIFILQV